MADSARFNTEILWSNNGDLEAIKSYCTSNVCRGEDYFRSGKDVCPSNRDGKCQMVEFMKERRGE